MAAQLPRNNSLSKPNAIPTHSSLEQGPSKRSLVATTLVLSLLALMTAGSGGYLIYCGGINSLTTLIPGGFLAAGGLVFQIWAITLAVRARAHFKAHSSLSTITNTQTTSVVSNAEPTLSNAPTQSVSSAPSTSTVAPMPSNASVSNQSDSSEESESEEEMNSQPGQTPSNSAEPVQNIATEKQLSLDDWLMALENMEEFQCANVLNSFEGDVFRNIVLLADKTYFKGGCELNDNQITVLQAMSACEGTKNQLNALKNELSSSFIRFLFSLLPKEVSKELASNLLKEYLPAIKEPLSKEKEEDVKILSLLAFCPEVLAKLVNEHEQYLIIWKEVFGLQGENKMQDKDKIVFFKHVFNTQIKDAIFVIFIQNAQNKDLISTDLKDFLLSDPILLAEFFDSSLLGKSENLDNVIYSFFSDMKSDNKKLFFSALIKRREIFASEYCKFRGPEIAQDDLKIFSVIPGFWLRVSKNKEFWVSEEIILSVYNLMNDQEKQAFLESQMTEEEKHPQESPKVEQQNETGANFFSKFKSSEKPKTNQAVKSTDFLEFAVFQTNAYSKIATDDVRFKNSLFSDPLYQKLVIQPEAVKKEFIKKLDSRAQAALKLYGFIEE